MRNWQSVRVILEGLILLAVVGLWSSMIKQSEATIALQTHMIDVTDQMHVLEGKLDGFAELTRAVTKLEVRSDEHDRRINSLEARADRQRQDRQDKSQ